MDPIRRDVLLTGAAAAATAAIASAARTKRFISSYTPKRVLEQHCCRKSVDVAFPIPRRATHFADGT